MPSNVQRFEYSKIGGRPFNSKRSSNPNLFSGIRPFQKEFKPKLIQGLRHSKCYKYLFQYLLNKCIYRDQYPEVIKEQTSGGAK